MHRHPVKRTQPTPRPRPVEPPSSIQEELELFQAILLSEAEQKRVEGLKAREREQLITNVNGVWQANLNVMNETVIKCIVEYGGYIQPCDECHHVCSHFTGDEVLAMWKLRRISMTFKRVVDCILLAGTLVYGTKQRTYWHPRCNTRKIHTGHTNRTVGWQIKLVCEADSQMGKFRIRTIPDAPESVGLLSSCFCVDVRWTLFCRDLAPGYGLKVRRDAPFPCLLDSDALLQREIQDYTHKMMNRLPGYTLVQGGSMAKYDEKVVGIDHPYWMCRLDRAMVTNGRV